MKGFVSIFIFICFLLFTNFQCDEDPPCDNPRGESSLSIDLEPEKATYTIGDTLLLQTDFGTSFPLPNTNELIDIKNGTGILYLFIMALGGDRDSLKGYTDFDIINFSGQLNQYYITDPVAMRFEGSIQFDCDSLHCGFKIGLVPKVKGNYCIAITNGEVIAQDTTYCPDVSYLKDNIFTVSDYHRDIFQELHIHNPIFIPGTWSSHSLDVIDNDGAYAFKVK